MKTTNQKRRGFTLPEVIVTITLIAALAAVVVPAVASQLKKGDPSRVASDAQAVRGAIEQFLSDVRRYPNSIGQLTNQIKTSEKPLTGTFSGNLTYLTGDSTRWKGPYLTKDSTAARVTGYGWTVATAFTLDTLPTSGATNSSTGLRYLVMRVLGFTKGDSTDASALDQTYDDGNVLTGAIRWRNGGGTAPDTLKILLQPIS
jgi:prepilin-type N-terminal cleavage/methylation domain-containing protein